MDQFHPDQALLNLLARVVTGDVHIWLTTFGTPWSMATTFANLHGAAVPSPTTVTAAAFTLSGVAGHVGTLTAADVLVTNTSGGPQTVTGYFITDTGDSVLLAAASFDAPVLVAAGDSVPVTPKFASASRFSS